MTTPITPGEAGDADIFAPFRALEQELRKEGIRLAEVHATMGTGYTVAADKLAACLAALPTLAPTLDLEPLKAVVDRNWSDETDQQVIIIAANALHWRNEALKRAALGSPSEAWQPIEQLKARIEKAGWPNQPGGLDVIYVNDVLDMLDELPAPPARPADTTMKGNADAD